MIGNQWNKAYGYVMFDNISMLWMLGYLIKIRKFPNLHKGWLGILLSTYFKTGMFSYVEELATMTKL